MCVCGPTGAKKFLNHHEMIRVATKYPISLKNILIIRKHQTVEIVKLNGSVELAPLVGLSEVIVDIVETELPSGKWIGSVRRGMSIICKNDCQSGKPKMENERIRRYCCTKILDEKEFTGGRE